MPSGWEIGDTIGHGACGVVNECTHPERPGQVFAIKRLQSDRIGSPELVKRFDREVAILRSLDHPNVMPVLDNGVTPKGVPWFVMLLGDRNLGEAINDPATRDERWAMATFRGILAGVAHAHGRGVLHRDLKPGNVMLLGGEPLISDLGIGKLIDVDNTTLTLSSQELGTLRFMAPEQFANPKRVGPPADVYALGKILGYMLTGVEPIPLAAYETTDLPARFHWFVDKCCRTGPDERFEDATTALAEFELISKATEDDETPTAESFRLLAHAAANNLGGTSGVDDLGRLARQLHQNRESREFYTNAFESVPNTVLRAWAKAEPGGFLEAVRTYDEHVTGDLPFSYCDTVARFLERIFNATSDFAVRRLCLTRLFEMGYSHNRWSVRETATGILTSLASPGDVALAQEVIRGHQREAAWVAEEALKNPMRNQLREALQRAEQTESARITDTGTPF